MKQPPFTYEEALKICEEFQHLVATPYDEMSDALVDAVIVSPYDQTNKSRFIMLYLVLNDAITALKTDCTNGEYDVLLISGSLNDNRLQYQSIRHRFETSHQRQEELA